MIRTISNKKERKEEALDFSKLHESENPRLQEFIASQTADSIPELKTWKMRSLQERNWKYTVPEDLAKKFSKAIHADNPDFEDIRQILIDIVSFVREAVGEDDFYEDSLLEDLEFADLENEDDVDYYIGEMYDTLDGYNVWMTPASWFDDEDDEAEDEEGEEDEENSDEDFEESKASKNKLTESLSFKDLHNVFVETVYDWKESGEKISPRLKDFSRKVIAGCILDDDEALKKIAYDYADVQEIAPPLYDALMNHLKSDTADLDPESSEKFAIEYYDVDLSKTVAGDPIDGSLMTEDSWTRDPKEALLFDTEEEAQAVLDETEEYYKDNDPDYPAFKMRVKKVSL